MLEHYVNKAVALAKREGVHTLSRERLSEHFQIPAGSFAYAMGVSYTEFMNRVAAELPLEQCKLSGARMSPELRKKQILANAVECAREHKYWGFSRKQVADRAGISEANVARLFTTAALREAVVRYGIEHNDADILAQARANNDKLLTA